MSSAQQTSGVTPAEPFSYYRARYYDPQAGRFLNEDPSRFYGGRDFYRFASNNPTLLVDPMGLSPADVQRIQTLCKKCTQGLTDAGLRRPGSGAFTGFLNDQQSWAGKKQGCKSQAYMVQPCMEGPIPPYDEDWKFYVVPWWLGSHSIVMARSLDPGDPIVYCDPWRNFSWTAPKQGNTDAGGGAW